VLVSTLTGPSQQTAARYGVRALRYTVEADGKELDEILSLVAFGSQIVMLRRRSDEPHTRTFTSRRK
jgi:hypothetical protein